MDDFWIILTGSLVAINCGLLGVFLILRKMAMVGDAISHSVLPGIVLAFLLANSKSGGVLLVGAAVFGLITTYLIELFYKKMKLQEDASIGVTFTWLFAIGVILISLFSQDVDLDQECVLYGDIAYTPFDIFLFKDYNLGPTSIWLQGTNLIIVSALLTFGYRGLLITSFDSSFAGGLGIQTNLWHYFLMAVVSLTVVLSFNAVGAILVVAFLVVPPSTAYLLTNSLNGMIGLTVILGIVSSVSGFFIASWLGISISASMAVVSGVLFIFAFPLNIISQRYGNSWVSE